MNMTSVMSVGGISSKISHPADQTVNGVNKYLLK